MRVVVLPADQLGCGWLRLIAPAHVLRAQGHDVIVSTASTRQVPMAIRDDTVVDVDLDADVVVFQRVTHPYIAQAVSVLRAKGVATVVDVDDDLTTLHPGNAAWAGLHPKRESTRGGRITHSWRNLNLACRSATLVTVSTPALLSVYGTRGHGRVLYNRLPTAYDDLKHAPVDPTEIVWPASYHSHPNDADVLGGSIARLVAEGAPFRMIGDPTGSRKALGLPTDPPGGGVPLDAWPRALAGIGIGIAPLADTRFNAAKSALKPLELSAAGVPWVASPRVEYTQLHQQGAGLLAKRPRDWYRQLRRLRESDALRSELGDAGREVAARHRLADHAWRWWEAWSDALKAQRT